MPNMTNVTPSPELAAAADELHKILVAQLPDDGIPRRYLLLITEKLPECVRTAGITNGSEEQALMSCCMFLAGRAKDDPRIMVAVIATILDRDTEAVQRMFDAHPA